MPSPTFFIDENIPFLADSLANCGRIIRFSGRNLTSVDLIKHQCTALFVRSITNVDSSLLSNTSVKFVGTATAGTDHVDQLFLKTSGIHFSSAAGSNSNAVAEYVIFAMLERFGSIRGKTVGIIGYGTIGRRVAEYCKRLGSIILIYDEPLLARGYVFPLWASHVSLMKLCTDSLIITNHVPLTFTGEYPTYGLLGKKELDVTQDELLIIHASRGGVIDENMLSHILETKQRTAVIDVWNNEPNINSQLATKALISTPHIAGYSLNAKLSGAKMMAECYASSIKCSPDYSLFEVHNENMTVNFNDESSIYSLLDERRQFMSDSRILKNSVLQSQNEKANSFDHQRKNYPERYETLRIE